MRLLLVHRYIRPDTPGYAHMLYIMGKHFASQGHDVTIFSAQPSYNNVYDGPKLPRAEHIDGMTIIRTWLFKENKKNPLLRAVNFFIFGISLFCHAVFRFKAYDVMTVTTFPPTIMGLVARAVRWFRRTKYIYHCMDLYPEVAETSGILKRSWLSKLATYVDRKNCQKAKRVVVLSEDMLNTIDNRGISVDHVEVINNFIIDTVDESVVVPEAFDCGADKFRVLFAGNIGRFQSLDVIVEAAKLLRDHSDVQFWFVGSGVMVEPLKEQSSELIGKTVFFHPFLPIRTAMSVIAESNLGIVSLSSGVIECAYPSKTMSYLEAGCKLLALVERDSSLADLVETENLGVVCGNPNPQEIADAIQSEYQQWRSGNYDREQIQAVGRKHFGQKTILDSWTSLLEEVDTPE